MIKTTKTNFNAYSLVEVVVAVGIIMTAAAIGMISFNSLSNKKDLQSEADNLKQDIYVMQSRAVSGLRHQRLNILSNSSYVLEEDTAGAGNYSGFQSVRTFRPNVFFYGHTGKETKLEFQPNGLPEFNGASANPFFSLIYMDTTEKKDFNIDSSGVVNIVSN